MPHPQDKNGHADKAIHQRGANGGDCHCGESICAECSSICPTEYQIPPVVLAKRPVVIATIRRITMTWRMNVVGTAGVENDIAVIFIPHSFNDEFCSQC